MRLWLSPSEGRKFDAALKAIVAPYMGRRADRARRAFLYTWFLAPAVSWVCPDFVDTWIMPQTS